MASVRTALQAAYKGLSAIHNARESAKTNPTWKEAQQILATADFGWKAQQTQIAPSFDRAIGELRIKIAEAEKELSAPLATKASDPIAAEIRAHVKAMKPSERMDFIRHAADAGDEITASAVLGTVPYLSGLDENIRDVFTRIYRERTTPAQAKRLAVMRGGTALLETAAANLHAELNKAISAAPDKVGALRKAKTKAEEAFILRD